MSDYQCPECGEQGKKYNSVLPSDIEEAFCPSCRSHWDIGLKSDNTNDDYAQVGAMLAKCDYFEAGRDGSLWWAWVRLPGKCQAFRSQGSTQLAAIRAAVETAEKGVRE